MVVVWLCDSRSSPGPDSNPADILWCFLAGLDCAVTSNHRESKMECSTSCFRDLCRWRRQADLACAAQSPANSCRAALLAARACHRGGAQLKPAGIHVVSVTAAIRVRSCLPRAIGFAVGRASAPLGTGHAVQQAMVQIPYAAKVSGAVWRCAVDCATPFAAATLLGPRS